LWCISMFCGGGLRAGNPISGEFPLTHTHTPRPLGWGSRTETAFMIKDAKSESKRSVRTASSLSGRVVQSTCRIYLLWCKKDTRCDTLGNGFGLSDGGAAIQTTNVPNNGDDANRCPYWHSIFGIDETHQFEWSARRMSGFS
jgi:hypothetical protein